jgi:Zn-dependent protease with chaperone function
MQSGSRTQAPGATLKPYPEIDTRPHIVGLLLSLCVLVPAGFALAFDVLIPDAWFELSYLLVGAMLYGVFWLVGSSLTGYYERLVEEAKSDVRRLSIPPSVNKTYGLMLVSLLPYLLYLFVFALYAVEFVVMNGLLQMLQSDSVPLFFPIGLLIMAAGSVWGVAIGAWRLLVPPRPRPAGAMLTRNDCPRLWAVVDKVAADSGTSTAQTVVLTPDASIAVWEDGSLPAVLSGDGRRHIQVGLSAIHDMTICEFMAILRHEFAHFANRDTRWGSFTHAMGQALVSAFAATPGLSSLARGFSWVRLVVAANPAWFVYAVFIRLFFRSTGGFSRLGEILADRDAILYAGGGPFARGLTKVIVNDAVFSKWAESNAIKAALSPGSVIGIAGAVSVAVRGMDPAESERVRDEAFATSRLRAGPYDSHPPLTVRLALARSMPEEIFADTGEPAWSLLDDWVLRDRQASEAWLDQIRRRMRRS